MPKPMSLAQYRASVKVLGEKSALFQYKKEIFEALDMGLSHEQIHYFLTTQKGLKISVRAVSKWIKTHKNTSIPFLQKQEQNETNISTIIKSPKVEPKEAPKNFDLSNDPKYAKMWQVAQERTKMREEALQEKKSENHDS